MSPRKGRPVHVRTMRDVAAAVRAERLRQGLTQAALAERLGVGRDWVVRLEAGMPRLEAQLVLDALVALGIPLATGTEEANVEGSADVADRHEPDDPFAAVFDSLT